MQLKYLFLLYTAKSVFISLVSSYSGWSYITDPRRYNATQLPPYTTKDGKSAPVNIIVGIDIRDVAVHRGDDDDHFMKEIDLKIKLTWLDSRLEHSREDRDRCTFSTDEDAIWTPPLVLLTDSDARFKDKYTSFCIYPNSTVTAKIIMEISLTQSYSQGHSNAFSIRLLSVHHTTEDLTLQWSEVNPLDETASNTEGFQIGICHMSVARITRRHQGNCSCLDLYFEDTKTSSVFIVYIPGIIAVMISWVCFWIAVPSVLANSAILTASVLHLTVQKVSIVKDLSLLENHQTLNHWLDVCIGFVLVSCFAVVGVTYIYIVSGRRITRRSEEDRHSKATTIQEADEEEGIVEGSAGEANTQRNHFYFLRIWFNRFPAADEINAICRVLFPLCFVIFLCVFFSAHH